MLVHKIINWLLVALVAPVGAVVATCILVLLLIVVLLPGGLEVLLLGWQRGKRWLVKWLPPGARRKALAWTAEL
jgi:hypothetical protein